MSENHKHKVEDTRKRSLLKALTGNGMEVIFDTIIFGMVFVALGMEIPHAAGIGFGLSVATELLCFVTNYFNDRVWNRVQWGRKVKDVSYVVKALEEDIENKKLYQKLFGRCKCGGVFLPVENVVRKGIPIKETDTYTYYTWKCSECGKRVQR